MRLVISCVFVSELVKEIGDVGTLARGSCVGELALLYNTPRAATITADTPSLLWSLDRANFSNIVKDAAMKKREKYDEFLKTVDILTDMDLYERGKLGDALKEERFKKDDMVIMEGTEGNIFYIISEGTAQAVKGGKNVKDYVRGEYFGERALLTNEKRAASIIATTDLVVVTLAVRVRPAKPASSTLVAAVVVRRTRTLRAA